MSPKESAKKFLLISIAFSILMIWENFKALDPKNHINGDTLHYTNIGLIFGSIMMLGI